MRRPQTINPMCGISGGSPILLADDRNKLPAQVLLTVGSSIQLLHLAGDSFPNITIVSSEGIGCSSAVQYFAGGA
eukprot:4582688-Amphidinium_carterae.1